MILEWGCYTDNVSPRPATRITLKARLIPILIGLLAILQLTFPYRGWLLLLFVLGGLWLVCYMWARSLSNGLHLIREMRYGWTQVGDRLEERFVLTNRSNMPALWVEVKDQSNMPGYDTSRGTGIEGLGTNEWRTQSVCTRRGVFSLGPTDVIAGDPFGIFTVQTRFQATQSLLVLPPIIPLPDIEVAPGGRAGEGRPRPNALERTVSSAGVREYLPGDSVHWVHWPTSARQGMLYVRTFESTPASDWWVILDMDRSTQAGAGDRSTVEHSITLAASLADLGIRSGKSLGFTAFGNDLVWLPPMGGDTQRWNILHAMALLGPGSLSLPELLSRVRPTLRQNTSLVVITASKEQRWIDSLILMMRGGTVPTVLLLDASAYEPMGQPKHTGDLASLLVSLGISCTTITPDLFDRPEARPGHLGDIEVRVLPNGRVVRVGREQADDWRSL